MFGHRYFGRRYFGPRYWGDGGALPPPPPIVTDHPSGGYDLGTLHERSLAGERRRRDLGIELAEAQVIADVAERQAASHARQRLDEQQRLDELRGELELRGLEMQSAHIEAMNAERERLIHVEIGERMRAALLEQQNNAVLTLLMLAS